MNKLTVNMIKENILTLDDIVKKVKDNDNLKDETFVREINIINEQFIEDEISLDNLKIVFGQDNVPIMKICQGSNKDMKICGCFDCDNVIKCNCSKDCNVHYLSGENKCKVAIDKKDKIKIVIPEGKEVMQLNKNYMALSIICKPNFLDEIKREKKNKNYKIIMNIKKK